MNYIQELEKCKTLKDLLLLRNAIVLHIEKLPTCVDSTEKRFEGLFYVKRIDTQVEYLEKGGVFLSDIVTGKNVVLKSENANTLSWLSLDELKSFKENAYSIDSVIEYAGRKKEYFERRKHWFLLKEGGVNTCSFCGRTYSFFDSDDTCKANTDPNA
jgi:hypothetical protein